MEIEDAIKALGPPLRSRTLTHAWLYAWVEKHYTLIEQLRGMGYPWKQIAQLAYTEMKRVAPTHSANSLLSTYRRIRLARHGISISAQAAKGNVKVEP